MMPATSTTKTRAECSVTAGGFRVIGLQNACVSVSFIPELGGKMISLKRVASGREFLLQPPERPYRRPAYGARFEDYDTSGFDECFPSVSSCAYTQGKEKVHAIPDHGELWSVPWEWEVSDGELLLTASGHVLPYVFRKRVSLSENRVVLDYEVENTGVEPFSFLWSAHPLLAVSPGCRITLPGEVNEMFVNWSLADRLGKFGDRCGWPIAVESDGTKVNLAELSLAAAKTADKLFTPRLNEGSCGVYYPASDESLSIHFDTSAVPYLGVWICQGGWPSPDRGHFTLALEPCSGRPDSLAEAVERGESRMLRAGEKESWSLILRIRDGGAPDEKSIS